jgi:hypothetical protein
MEKSSRSIGTSETEVFRDAPFRLARRVDRRLQLVTVDHEFFSQCEKWSNSGRFHRSRHIEGGCGTESRFCLTYLSSKGKCAPPRRNLRCIPFGLSGGSDEATASAAQCREPPSGARQKLSPADLLVDFACRQDLNRGRTEFRLGAISWAAFALAFSSSAKKRIIDPPRLSPANPGLARNLGNGRACRRSFFGSLRDIPSALISSDARAQHARSSRVVLTSKPEIAMSIRLLHGCISSRELSAASRPVAPRAPKAAE